MATRKTTKETPVKDLSIKEQLAMLPVKNNWAQMQSCPHCGCDIKNLCPSGFCENPSCTYKEPENVQRFDQ